MNNLKAASSCSSCCLFRFCDLVPGLFLSLCPVAVIVDGSVDAVVGSVVVAAVLVLARVSPCYVCACCYMFLASYALCLFVLLMLLRPLLIVCFCRRL